jgi:hypothetical protein
VPVLVIIPPSRAQLDDDRFARAAGAAAEQERERRGRLGPVVSP